MELKNHPGMWLRDDAAAAINALEDEFGVIRINRAGVAREEQQKLIDRWNKGGPYNRPPYLYRPADPPETSNHVQGTAVDVYNYNSDRDKLVKHGFKPFGSSDPVHYDFVGVKQTITVNRSVVEVQRIVGAVPDGIYGPDTTAKVKAWQSANGLTADGIWGPLTDARAFPTTKSNKTPGELTYRDIQEALNRHGYGLIVDGIWGPKSKAALADFQRKNGLIVDRIVGPLTWAKLNK